MSRCLVLLALIILCNPAFSQKLYKWTDENGRVHYGDKPASSNKNNATIIKTQKPHSQQPQKVEAENVGRDTLPNTSTVDLAKQPNLPECLKLAKAMDNQKHQTPSSIRSQSKKLLALCPDTAYKCSRYSSNKKLNTCKAVPMTKNGPIHTSTQHR